MPETYGDWVDITNSATADAKSAAGTISVNAGAVIVGIILQSRPVDASGNVYAVELEVPNLAGPQKYIMSCNGQPMTNGTKENAVGKYKKVRIPLPAGTSQVKVYTYADVASAQGTVGLMWEAP